MFRSVAHRFCSPAVASKSRILHFPQIYSELGLDLPLGHTFSAGDAGAAGSPKYAALEKETAASINALGTVVPHTARDPVRNANAVPVRAWIDGVPVEWEALAQVEMMSTMSAIIPKGYHISVMPDLHFGNGATVGSVLPFYKAVVPAAVGVDCGCGINAVRTSLREADLPSDLDVLRFAIELAVPHGRTHNGQPNNDAGGWRGNIPRNVAEVWRTHLEEGFRRICAKRPEIEKSNSIGHLGSLGSGNHSLELSVEEEDPKGSPHPKGGSVWIMVHSGSRGVGARIGNVFTALARKDMGEQIQNLPNEDLAYFTEGTKHFDEYCEALTWAQKFARLNRECMIEGAIAALRGCGRLPPFTTASKDQQATNEHHTYVSCVHNFVERVKMPDGKEVMLTRKGATSAKKGEMAVIPGSMGTPTFIVRGRGNEESYCSCAHGAGRRVSRGQALRRFSVDDHTEAVKNVACRKDASVVDETPLVYKPIEDVIRAQTDLVDVVAKLRPRCVIKG